MAPSPTDSVPRQDRSRWLGVAQVALIVIGIAVALYLARAPDRTDRGALEAIEAGSGGSARESASRAVTVMHPNRTAQSTTVTLTGTVNATRWATIQAEIVGRVVWISPRFRTGGAIAAHEPIVRIDPAEFELVVEAAAAAVRAAEALVEIQGDGDRAARRLAEARLAQAQAELKIAELRLARTRIALPYDVRVIATDIEIGELVGPPEDAGGATDIGIVYRNGDLMVQAPIEPRVVASLDPVIGRAARVVGQTGVWNAEVVRVSSIIAMETGLTALSLEFLEEMPIESLPLPGTFVEIEIAGPAHQDVYVLPEAALREGDSVWIVKDGVLSSITPARIGRTGGGRVVEAFDVGDGVVIGPVPGARDGLPVAVADAAR